MILLAHGASSNAGDHLIKNRATRLLQLSAGDDANLAHAHRGRPFQLAQAPAGIVVAGGPLLAANAKDQLRWVQELRARFPEVPTVILGVGIGGPKSPGWTPAEHFPSESHRSLVQAVCGGAMVSVRDRPSQSVLRELGVRARLTGCPALYADGKAPRLLERPLSEVMVSLSRPRVTLGNLARQARFCRQLSGALQPSAALAFVAQHGRTGIDFPISFWVERLGWTVVDAKGVGLDEVPSLQALDAHVGGRLHAGIFMLSRGRPSFLFDVDLRTWGFIETYGAPSGSYSPEGIEAAKRWLEGPRHFGSEMQDSMAATHHEMERFLEEAMGFLVSP